MRKWIPWSIPLIMLLLSTLAHAQLLGGGTGIVGDPITVRTAVSAEPLLPGTQAQIAVELTINPRYHIQSAFAGPDYKAAQLTVLSVPPGVQVGAIQAQKGTDIPTPPALGTGTMSIYAGKAYFLVPLKIAPDRPPGTATLELSLETQACTDTSCDLPRQTLLNIPLTIAPSGTSQKQPAPDLFAALQSKSFAPQPALSRALPTPSPTSTASTAPGKQVLLLSTAEQLALIAQRGYKPHNSDEDQHAVLAIFLFALLGGLILNVMPCVLPVIPLKAVSFVQQAHGDKRLALLHGLTFSAGIVTLFVALAIVLRLFGLFYGQQFQSPTFLIIMVLLVVALALSMFGVWTFEPPRAVYAADEKFAHRAGFLGSFSNGLLATLLATPCSAPFLGPVFAWALVRPAWLTAAALATVGVGMSLPYLLLAFFPNLLGKMPRAGRWSELLKQNLGIVMLGVAIYLVTLVPHTQLWPWVLAGAVVVALACWGWGQIPTPLMTAPRIWTIRAIVLVICAALGAGIIWISGRLANPPTTHQALTVLMPEQTTAGDEWLPFNIALLDQALQDGRPVLVDWTADWCLNCRVLEATVLSRAQLQQAIVSRNAVLLRADLSEENPPATALNRQLGGEAIPVLAIFSPSRPHEPVVLRDSYTPTRVIQELDYAH